MAELTGRWRRREITVSICSMRYLLYVQRSIHAVGVVLLLLTPLLVDSHLHGVDHDGTTQHIESAHGGHFSTVAELDARVRSAGVNVSFDSVLAASAFDSSVPSFGMQGLATPWVHRPSRGPPGSVRSRAPPRLS